MLTFTVSETFFKGGLQCDQSDHLSKKKKIAYRKERNCTPNKFCTRWKFKTPGKTLGPLHMYLSLRAQTTFSTLWKSIFSRGISLPSTDITHIRIKHSLNATFWKTLSREERSRFLAAGVEGWKRKTIESETSRYLISRGTRMFHCRFLFLTSVACWSLLFLITSLSVGLLLSPVKFENRSVQRLSRGRQAVPRTYLYTNVLCK